MIKRSKLLHFMNTGTGDTATYSLMGPGITNLSINKNPSYTEEGYIHQDVATKTLDSLAPEFAYEINADAIDPVAVYIADLEWEDKTMAEAETDIVTVQMWKTPTGTPAVYPAKKYLVSIAVESIGDEALKPVKYSVKAGVRGDAIMGTFDPEAKTFTATPAP